MDRPPPQRRGSDRQPPDRQQIGRHGEDQAVAALQAAGFDILLRNYRCRSGELDIVARTESLLVIAEVRCRSRSDYGGAAASVTWRKQQRIVRASRHLLMMHPALARLPVRFDVLVPHPGGGIEWLRAAFAAG
jgi:putative endonuclease